MPGAQENFGTLEMKDGELQVTEAARAKYIKTWREVAQEQGLLPEAIPIDLEDRVKWGDWHKKWIDGSYRSILLNLNLEPNAMLPIMDPTFAAGKLNLDVPDVDLLTIIGSFALPQLAIPALLNVKPLEIPSFLPKLADLIKVPEIPALPEVPAPPDIYVGPIGLPPEPFPSHWNFTALSLFGTVPGAITGLFGKIANPEFLISFTPDNLIKVATEAMSAVFPAPQTSNPLTQNVNVATLSKMCGEAMGPAVTSVTIGATKMNTALGEVMGYKKPPEPVKETPTDAKAMLNNLYRLRDQTNLKVYFQQRELYYGDPFTIDMMEALAKHLNESTAYRKSAEEGPWLLEVGNITGWDREVKSPTGARYSDTHGGGSVDIAYPMRDENGAWMSGMNQDSAITKGTEAGEPSQTGYKCVDGNAAAPFKLSTGELALDFAALYEMLYFLYYDFQMKIVKEDRFVAWQGVGLNVPPLETILMGRRMYAPFSEWCAKNNKTLEKPKYWRINKKLFKRQAAGYMITPYGKVVTGKTTVGDKETPHEDHMHFNVCRISIVIPGDPEYKKDREGEKIYKCAGGKSDNIKKEGQGEYFRYKKVTKDDPKNPGKKIDLRY